MAAPFAPLFVRLATRDRVPSRRRGPRCKPPLNASGKA
jgi:hypothetical protein